jgi:hypothetical protein
MHNTSRRDHILYTESFRPLFSISPSLVLLGGDFCNAKAIYVHYVFVT